MIPLFKVHMADTAKELVGVTLDSGYIGEGTRAKEFEEKINEAFKMKGIRLVNSCTTAIDLALHMIGLKPGDEVITTAITCTATNSPVVNRGAIPVWADVDPYTGLITPENVARKISKKTKAIIGVNWGGRQPDYRALKDFGLPVIEDAAHGPYWSNAERGDYVVWSFQAIKHLTTGDGGALYSSDPDRARLLRWYGLDRESKADFRCAQNIQEVGYKAHMNDIAASIGLANLPYLPILVSHHNYNAAHYDRFLHHKDIKKPMYYSEHPFWLYTLIVEDRDQFSAYLTENGIANSQVHARNDKHDAFKRAASLSSLNDGNLPGVAYFDNHQLSIPVGWFIDRSDLSYITHTINNWKQ